MERGRTMAYGETDKHKEKAFDTWIAGIEVKMLECRVNGHDWPDWSDRKRAAWRKSRATKTITVEVPCKRKCGTTLTRFMDEGGYYVHRNLIRHYYDPEFGYLMPPEARGPGLTRERRAKLRAELIERLSEWITEE
jgi:hypothetical protein